MNSVPVLSSLQPAAESKTETVAETVTGAKTETKSLFPHLGTDGDGVPSPFAQLMMTETGEEQQDDELNLFSSPEDMDVLSFWQAMIALFAQGLQVDQSEGKSIAGFKEAYQSIQHILFEQMNNKDQAPKIEQVMSMLTKQGSNNSEWLSYIINRLQEDIQVLTVARNQATAQGENRANLHELWRDMGGNSRIPEKISSETKRIPEEIRSHNFQITGAGMGEQARYIADFEKVYQIIKHILLEQMNRKAQATDKGEHRANLDETLRKLGEYNSRVLEEMNRHTHQLTGNMTSHTNKGPQVEFPAHLPLSLLNQTGEGEEKQERMVPPKIENRAMPQETVQVSSGRTEKTIPTLRYQHLTEDINDLFRVHLQRLSNEGTSQIRVRLHPEHLGHLDIRITSMEGKVSAQLLTNNHFAQEALEKQVHQLRFAIMQQGIQVDKIEISQQNQSQQTPSHSHLQNFSQQEDHKGGQPFLKQENQNNRMSTTEDAYSEADEIPEELLLEQLFYDMQDDGENPAPIGIGSKINFAV